MSGPGRIIDPIALPGPDMLVALAHPVHINNCMYQEEKLNGTIHMSVTVQRLTLFNSSCFMGGCDSCKVSFPCIGKHALITRQYLEAFAF